MRLCPKRECDFDLGFPLVPFGNRVEAWCSWCFRRTVHGLVKFRMRFLPRRETYLCTGCGMQTLPCRFCGHMARGGPRWDDDWCAEHGGTIGSFENLERGIDALEDYRRLFERRVQNVKRVARVALGVCGGVVVAVPAALLAGPAIGGAIGVKLYGLSGAAATAKGLAVLGGGAVGTGPLAFGMAGGAVTIGLLGASFGGAFGAVLANAYFGQIDGFDVLKKREGSGPSVICVDGFLTQGKNRFAEWEPTLRAVFPGNPWYHLSWESKRLEQLGGLMASDRAERALVRTLCRAARSASKRHARFLGLPAALYDVASLLRNPWHVALYKAQLTGFVFATIISRLKTEAHRRQLNSGKQQLLTMESLGCGTSLISATSGEVAEPAIAVLRGRSPKGLWPSRKLT